MKKIFLLAVGLGCFTATEAQQIVSEKKEAGGFTLVSSHQTATILADGADPALVKKAAELFQHDVEMVSGKKPGLSQNVPANGPIVLIGTCDSKFIRQLIKAKKFNADKIKNKWEAYQVQIVNAPFKGISQALVIAGSDRRGAAYGIFELSKQIGVSPWYWWADVPVKEKKEIYVAPNAFLSDAPKIKYRGIFINDEAPAFSGWTKEKFGGVNHLVYEKIFELLLRLKANYLWPAMWGNAFNDDDTLNPILANEWGIVMGTSHHEPMLRAQQEWKRYGKGAWDYTKNDTVLRAFWKKGIENMGDHESIVTIGMRGDGDMPMTQGTATALLEHIVADQRKIIEDVTGKPASQTPQLWALYKEVQDYYDKGMRVPDDATLLLCDDNWGNIRKLPKLTDKKRAGGYGIYYHFDYVGGPRNYKWINTNNIARVWEQMHLAYEYGVDKIWIVNVGDLKPMEFPISFFLDYAWDTKKWNEDKLRNYYTEWASQQFGPAHAKAIGDIIRKYSQYNARRKPELLSPDTYQPAYGEARKVVSDYSALLQQAEEINTTLPSNYRDAFFELVLHPVKASANLNALYLAVAENRYEASQKLAQANDKADYAKQLYLNDSLITLQYHTIANGKWNHMMDQTHIGYTYWQQPPFNKMPEVKYLEENNLRSAIAQDSFARSARDLIPPRKTGNLFYESYSYVSIEAEHWTQAINSGRIKWKVIPDIGRDGSGISSFPVTASAQLAMNSPHVDYEFYCYDTATVSVNLYFSPTLNFHNDEGLQFAVSIDDEKPQVITLNKEDNNVRTWENWVANNIIVKTSSHSVSKTGKHLLRYWMISPAVVLQKLVIDFGGLERSYLGPPETKR